MCVFMVQWGFFLLPRRIVLVIQTTGLIGSWTWDSEFKHDLVEQHKELWSVNILISDYSVSMFPFSLIIWIISLMSLVFLRCVLHSEYFFFFFLTMLGWIKISALWLIFILIELESWFNSQFILDIYD